MCAIAGVIGHPQALELVQHMTATQAHRGPDSGAVERLAPEAAFGHRRLAILDLSERGAQPMTSACGRWTIVFNGELFNYRELRRDLAVRWRSETDTEVLLEAVAAWGLERTLTRSNGMFAFALWDRTDRTLLLARDRIGEKPLVYFHEGKTFAFASEMKALAPLHASRIDPAALDVYLALGYIPAPLGVFVQTGKLPPGHYAIYRNGTLEIRRWWFPETASFKPHGSSAERCEEARALIADSVRLRLRADVPVALALSGGVDSSVIAAETARQNVRPEAFTVTFDHNSTDLPYARQVAQQFGLPHTVVPADRDGVASRVSASIEQFDEPFADSSAVACLTMAEALRGRTKVLLNGDGGDETFGGYRHYEHIGLKQTLKAAAAAAGWRDGGTAATTYVQSKVLFRAADRAILLGGRTANALDGLLAQDPYLRESPGDALKRALWTDRHLHLANGLTHKTDMAFSASGIESRAPLLDPRILEWTQTLPDADLVRGSEKKVLLRQAYRNDLPASVLNRRKQGFGAPIASWLAGPLKEQVSDLLPCPLLDTNTQQGVTGQQQWTLFTLAQWARRWGASW